MILPLNFAKLHKQRMQPLHVSKHPNANKINSKSFRNFQVVKHLQKPK